MTTCRAVLPAAFALVAYAAAGCETIPTVQEAPIVQYHIKAWQWGYEPAQITVRKGATVRFTSESLDVEHSLVNKELGLRLVIGPRGSNPATAQFEPRRAGTYTLTCESACGPGNGRQILKLHVIH